MTLTGFPTARYATPADACREVPVAILLAVRNGAPDLPDQLDSIARQTHRNWRILASDDGSMDATRDILEGFAADGHALTLLDGPRQGAAENFMALIRAMPAHAPAESWLAFCDQDDVWLPDRLSRGIAALEAADPEQPALYCSRTWITDAALRGRRLSMPRPRPPSFRNALVQNIAAGNTILLNPPAARLAAAAATEAGPVVVHDWWIYQIVTGAGGRVVHDDRPTLLYRQHEVNEIGANDTTRARARRIRMLLQGHFRDWNEVNIAALRRSAHRLTPENARLLEEFDAMRSRGVPGRLAGIRRLGLYRQSRASSAALWLAALLGRL